VVLLSENEEIQKVDLDLTCDIIYASTSDPYVSLLTEEGQVILLTLVGERLIVNFTQLHKVYILQLLIIANKCS